MPIMIIKLPEKPGPMPLDVFCEILMQHRVFTKSPANARARQGIRVACKKVEGGAMRLSAEDYACLKVAVETPEYEERNEQGVVTGYVQGYGGITAAGVEFMLPTIDAILAATEETAEAPKAEPKPEAPTTLSSVP